MQPKLIQRGQFHVVGLRERFVQGHVEGLYELWGRFSKRESEVRDEIPCVCYGVIEPIAGEQAFHYTAGAGVTSTRHVPSGMSAVTVPAGRYAVWTHKGPISTFCKTVQVVWREWLPASGLKPTGATEFELYDERFRMEDPASECDVYVPVQ